MTLADDWPEAWWSETRALAADLWRGVEAQHLIATMKLVDDLREQEALERLLEGSKPPNPARRTQPAPHFLLFTPFRYRSPAASRFRRAGQPGIWYGAEELETACAELAYWRWRFLSDSEGLEDLHVELTFFQARVDGRVLDLMAPPWNANRSDWMRPNDYGPTHRLADHCRDRAAADWIRYESVRRPGGTCAAVLSLAALTLPDPTRQQTWSLKVRRNAAMMIHQSDRLEFTYPVTE